MTKFSSNFPPGIYVYADGDASLKMRVTAHLFRDNFFVSIECSWFANGEQKQAWIEEWRLSYAK